MTTEAQETAIIAHGRILQGLFPATLHLTPGALCRKLRRAECALARFNTDACNREVTDREIQAESDTVERVKALLWGPSDSKPDNVPPLKFNTNPMGYALKIPDRWMRDNRDRVDGLCRDWGGYGIIAPEIDQKGRSF